MKYVMMFLLLFSVKAFAQDASKDAEYTGNKPQPAILKDAQIDVTLKSGQKSTFSANEYKVVTRESSKRVQALIDSLRAALKQCMADKAACEEKVSKLEDDAGMSAKAMELEEGRLDDARRKVASMDPLPNRITVLLGAGPDGVAVEDDDGGKTVRPRTSALWGVTYARRVYGNWSATGTAIAGTSPKSRTWSLLAGAGYDF